jgi:hypothetical protein
MPQFTVKIKDLDQKTTHTVSQLADNQAEANRIALKILKRMLNTQNLEIK